MKTWLYLINPFISASTRNYKLALKISIYHNAQLQAHNSDPFFAPLAIGYEPFHTTLTTAYTYWQTQGGKQKGSTLTLDQMISLLSPTQLNKWEYVVQGVYPKGTSGYTALFPNGRKPFNSGSKDGKIAAVKALGEALATVPELKDLKTEVDTFYAQMKASRDNQLGHIGNKENKSNELEAAITAALTQMYANLGACITHFADNPSLAEPFFDLDTIRNHDQLVFKRTVKRGTIKNVLQHTFAATDTINIINDGNADLEFYMAAKKKDAIGELSTIVVKKGETQVVKLSDLQVENSFLNVYNAHELDGHCIVELL